MDRVLILNGAPRSGKDTLRQLMFAGNIFEYQTHGSFKLPLQEMAAAVLGMPIDDFMEQYETIKDLPCPNGLPLTVRQLMIKISEEWVKPLGGKRYFGDLAYSKALIDCAFAQRWPLAPVAGRTVVFTDGGFGEECQKFVECIGAENIYIVRINRPGFDFSMDSRRLLTKEMEGLENCQFFDLTNDGTERDLMLAFSEVVLAKIKKDSQV